MFWVLGFRIRRFKHSIHSFEANYKNSQEGKLPGVVVSNHVSFLDVFLLFQEAMAFLSKEAVAKAPFFGTFAVDRQCIFVNRDETKDKERVLEILKERMEKASHGKISPICVFAEGTVSNGRSLMKFKKGAFVTDTPIKIMGIKWGSDTQFCPSIANINIIVAIFFTWCQPFTDLEVHELDQDFDPLYSYNRRGIKTRDENSWEYVAEDVKNIMSFMTGYESSN
jgi:1-acyl-sn-glycerol-3-phosphate acyltransferase